VIKGEGGEFERNPDARTLVVGIQNGVGYELEWPMLNPARSDAEESFDLSHFIAVWKGETEHAYGTQAVISTMALALYSLQKASSIEQAMTLAQTLWEQRQTP
jgi:anthranilate phosphoribosyltransferase